MRNFHGSKYGFAVHDQSSSVYSSITAVLCSDAKYGSLLNGVQALIQGRAVLLVGAATAIKYPENHSSCLGSEVSIASALGKIYPLPPCIR